MDNIHVAKWSLKATFRQIYKKSIYNRIYFIQEKRKFFHRNFRLWNTILKIPQNAPFWGIFLIKIPGPHNREGRPPPWPSTFWREFWHFAPQQSLRLILVISSPAKLVLDLSLNTSYIKYYKKTLLLSSLSARTNYTCNVFCFVFRIYFKLSGSLNRAPVLKNPDELYISPKNIRYKKKKICKTGREPT